LYTVINRERRKKEGKEGEGRGEGVDTDKEISRIGTADMKARKVGKGRTRENLIVLRQATFVVFLGHFLGFPVLFELFFGELSALLGLVGLLDPQAVLRLA